MTTDNRPILGFTGYEWKIWRKCVKCSRKIKRGVVNVHHVGHEHDPKFRCMCWECYHQLMEDTRDQTFDD